MNSEWDDKIAYRLAVASNCTYDATNERSSITNSFKRAAEEAKKVNPDVDVLDDFLELQPDNVEFFETTGKYVNDKLHAAILVKVSDGLILAFRGTQGRKDWLNNLFVTSVDDLISGTLHENGAYYGFDRPLKILKDQILRSHLWSSVQNQNDKTLYITGHSKGGALATGATVDFDDKFEGEKVTYTFEAARFYTPKGQEGKKDILDKIWRFEYQYDIVPHLPLGQVTYEYLSRKKEEYPIIFESIARIIGLENNWLETNNFNLVSSGRLAYVDGNGNWNDDTQKYKSNDSDYYGKRALESLEKTFTHTKISNPLGYVLAQHNECYLEYLKRKALRIDLNDNLSA